MAVKKVQRTEKDTFCEVCGFPFEGGWAFYKDGLYFCSKPCASAGSPEVMAAMSGIHDDDSEAFDAGPRPGIYTLKE